MSKWLWLAAGLAVLVGIAAALLLPREQRDAPPAPPAPARVAPPPDIAAPAPQPPAPQPPQAAQPAAKPELWRQVAPDAVAAAMLPRHREEVPGRVLVAFAAGLGDWRVGDDLQIGLPQLDDVFSARVEAIHRGPGGNRAFTGTLANGAVGGAGAGGDGAADAEHGFVLTVGPANTFAQISTPHGSYELVGNRRFGWLMPTANMDRDVDYSVPDYRPTPRAETQPRRVQR